MSKKLQFAPSFKAKSVQTLIKKKAKLAFILSHVSYAQIYPEICLKVDFHDLTLFQILDQPDLRDFLLTDMKDIAIAISLARLKNTCQYKKKQRLLFDLGSISKLKVHPRRKQVFLLPLSEGENAFIPSKEEQKEFTKLMDSITENYDLRKPILSKTPTLEKICQEHLSQRVYYRIEGESYKPVCRICMAKEWKYSQAKLQLLQKEVQDMQVHKRIILKAVALYYQQKYGIS